MRLEIKGRQERCKDAGWGVHMVNLDLAVHAEGTSFGQMRRKGRRVVSEVGDGILVSPI
jgi:hypothetical protein